MAAFPCPYCARDLIVDDDAKLERCPSCDGSLLIAYRHRLIAAHGKVSGGVLYEAVDDGFGEHVAVLFVDKPEDPVAVERFVEGNRLFADLGGRGLVKIQDIGTEGRPYVVMDWLTSGPLDRVIPKRGVLPQPALLELVGDLLTGVGKAHRAMPAIVHGHIHPGKIGFRRKGEVVLFGFEWATKVNAQASRLADSYSETSGSSDKRSPHSDVRQLAAVFMYAATGEWVGELELDRQRERVRARLPGPLGQLVDRMLGAGVDGYASAVEAAIDFDQLLRGASSATSGSMIRARS
jgi:serine/threonine protein kinase